MKLLKLKTDINLRVTNDPEIKAITLLLIDDDLSLFSKDIFNKGEFKNARLKIIEYKSVYGADVIEIDVSNIPDEYVNLLNRLI